MVSHQTTDKLTKEIEDLRNSLGEKVSKKLDLDNCHQLIQRLGTLSSECETCYQSFNDLESHLVQLLDKPGQLTKNDFKHHHQKINNISTHLMKKHKLVTKDYYLSIYMSCGLSIGLVFGLLFDNLALGLPIGLGIGVTVGAILDADVKKKGRTI
ncbi:hypothetical protein [Oceanobacillus jeddahense]|uniref:Glycine zipper-like domain-containing protein n=1 Tax=Oceanobacillus jeddahense TaxID=1462527 RepID=A0ABY5JLH3_9BACI|nr:hypothetical protein [Oceanobacillus jeddahense]UUI01161.1 hypothetical protein NP439_13935 [Oceanobacillus jeddahense]